MDDDIPTAILTKGQREYLRGEREPTQERTMKARIRQRVQTALSEDVPLLVGANKSLDHVEGADLKEFRRGLEATVRLVYQLADAAGHDPDELIDDVVREFQYDRADEIWEGLERGAIRADFDELETLRDGGRIPDEAYTAAFKKRLGKPDGLTLEEIIEAWEEAREQPADPADLFESSIDDELDLEETDDVDK
jgi:hypothetical protein